jgi:hypothetical protein
MSSCWIPLLTSLALLILTGCMYGRLGTFVLIRALWRILLDILPWILIGMSIHIVWKTAAAIWHKCRTWTNEHQH